MLKVVDLHKKVVDLQKIVNAVAATTVAAKDNISVSHVESSYNNSYNFAIEKMIFEEARKILVFANDALVERLNEKDVEIKRLNDELVALCGGARANKEEQGMLFQPPALKAAAAAAAAAQKEGGEEAASAAHQKVEEEETAKQKAAEEETTKAAQKSEEAAAVTKKKQKKKNKNKDQEEEEGEEVLIFLQFPCQK
jgi:hypothetical protein